MCAPALPIIGAAAAVAGAGASIVNGAKQRKAAKKAAQQAEAEAAATKAANERAINAANQKQPNLASILGMNRDQTSGGIGSTRLTGGRGLDLDQSLLGRSTLLGA